MAAAEAHRAQIRGRGRRIGDDEHVARLALSVGIPRGVAVQVLDVVAQAFFGEQARNEGQVALAVLGAQAAGAQALSANCLVQGDKYSTYINKPFADSTANARLDGRLTHCLASYS